MKKQRWEESEKRRGEKRRGEERRGEERRRREETRREEKRREEKRRGEERRGEERRKSQKKESEERVRRKSQKKESEERVRRKSQKKDAGARKNRNSRETDEKLHSVVARSTLRSQNAQNTSASEQFLGIEMSKKCTPLWREAHVEVKMYKAPHVRTTFGSWGVEKVHAVVARSTFPSQNV